MFNTKYSENVDAAYEVMIMRNNSDEYDHASYRAAENMLKAWIVLYCEGDEKLAQGMMELMRGNGDQGVYYFSYTVPEDEIRQYA